MHKVRTTDCAPRQDRGMQASMNRSRTVACKYACTEPGPPTIVCDLLVLHQAKQLASHLETRTFQQLLDMKAILRLSRQNTSRVQLIQNVIQRMTFLEYLLQNYTYHTLHIVLQKRTDLDKIAYFLYCGQKNQSKESTQSAIMRQVYIIFRMIKLPKQEQLPEQPLVLQMQNLINEV